MASWSHENEQSVAFVSEEGSTDPDVSDTEIDSYIISIPELRKKAPKPAKAQRQVQQHAGDVHAALEATSTTLPSDGDVSTPRPSGTNARTGSQNIGVGMNAFMTPRSLRFELSEAEDLRWAKASVLEEQPLTPSPPPKRKGWFGTDGRAWLQGTKNPSNAKPWIDV
ncbi:hypothetical protein LTR85_005787 [Meristemomyces frigidus]|nr:hypothetical protein LTR85_005787 [Meristemomyces frigidus]